MELGLKADATQAKTPALHAVFSDGITYVSVFIEPYSQDRHAQPMLSSSGATHTMTSRLGDHWITVVGDVPVVTLKAFTQSLDRRK
jgi:sigma-E factor negative regulatory protein RseB